MNIEQLTVDHLLHMMEGEFPPYARGPQKCATCNKPARWVYCVSCLIEELSRRGCSALAEQLHAAHYKRFEQTKDIRQIEQKILEAAK